VDLAKELLISSNRSVAQIARQLDFDPSNFTKFFKIYEGTTPKKFREANWALKTEVFTIFSEVLTMIANG